jgi:hypothetical protein
MKVHCFETSSVVVKSRDAFIEYLIKYHNGDALLFDFLNDLLELSFKAGMIEQVRGMLESCKTPEKTEF